MRPLIAFTAFCIAVSMVSIGCAPDDNPAPPANLATHDLAAQAEAEMAFVVAATEAAVIPAPVPDENPDGVTCENCGGDGELGDGRTKIECPECGGDGIRARDSPADLPQTEEPNTTDTPASEPNEARDWPPPERLAPANHDPVTGWVAKGPTVLMLTRKHCPPCVGWWGVDRHHWVRKGWDVAKLDAGDLAVPTPTFRIYDNGRWYNHVGRLTFDDGKRLLGRQ